MFVSFVTFDGLVAANMVNS